ncbi:MAG TPA: diacylglycerol kinase family protein [Ktedonobacteraceae bacterium]|nr:diacylglycerol kinase family protein [Ktedonobacteraceae bacterium]
MPQRVLVVHSPHSGRSSKLPDAIKHLEQAGLEVVNSISIADLDNLPAQGIVWKESGIDVAISAGGDGLVGGVTTHIAESGLPLGILPLGTSNDIARALHIPQNIGEAAQVIAQGVEQEVDVGVGQPAEQAPHAGNASQPVEAATQNGSGLYGYFAHALTVGVNVQFAHIATNVATRERFGRMTYPYAALKTAAARDALDIRLDFEGLAMPEMTATDQEGASPAPATPEALTTLRCRALQVAVINTPIFGGEREFAIAGSSFEDRLLDIVVFEQMDMGTLGKNIARSFAPRKHTVAPLAPGETRTSTHHPAELTGIPGMHHVQARGVTITTSADPRDVTFDGEVRGHTPIYVHVADKRLRVRVPDQVSTT